MHTASKLSEQDATADSGDTGGECWLLIVNHKFLTMNGYQCCIHYFYLQLRLLKRSGNHTKSISSNMSVFPNS